jgi:hypothetical protein
MGDFLTHILLADDVTDKIESRRIYEGVMKKRSLYRLGAQGPDPFYFYNIFPGWGDKELRKMGGILHKQSTGAFLKAGFERLSALSWEDSWMDLAVYLAGFICHFNLDRLLHPYVWWGSRVWIWSMDGIPAKATHQEIEVALDVILWREMRGGPAYRVNTRKLMDIGHKWPQSVQDFLQDALAEIYGVRTDPKAISKVLRDYYWGHDRLYDPRGWKKGLVSWLDAFTGGGIKPPKAPYPKRENETVDWANKKKRTWTNPFTEEEVYQTSVEDILKKASFEAANQINTVFSRILNREPIADLFPDISYDTGLLLSEHEI